jgi:hypothetical protein
VGGGCGLRGQEEAGRMLAEYVDEDFRLIRAGLTEVKEKFMQPLCVHGVGCGVPRNRLNTADTHLRIQRQTKRLFSDLHRIKYITSKF